MVLTAKGFNVVTNSSLGGISSGALVNGYTKPSARMWGQANIVILWAGKNDEYHDV